MCVQFGVGIPSGVKIPGLKYMNLLKLCLFVLKSVFIRKCVLGDFNKICLDFFWQIILNSD